MNETIARVAREHGATILGWVAACAITAALLSACSGSCAGTTGDATTAQAKNTAAPALTAAPNQSAAAGSDVTMTPADAVRPAPRHMGPSAKADDAVVHTDQMTPTDVAVAPAADPAIGALERGHTRTLVGWSDKGLVVTYAGWFCDTTMALREGKVDSKTARVTAVGASDGNGVGCDKPSAVTATFTNVPRTAHVLEFDPGHGRRIETVKFTSGDMVDAGSFTTEETAAGINDKHAAH